jgi:actin-related protein
MEFCRGAGMVNICYAMFGTPVFSFSVVNSGDWIDQQSAKATGESIAVINKEKMSVDLTKDGNSLIQNTIKLQYELMIQKAVSGIKKAFDELGTKVRSESALDVVVAGGTSSPNGFDKLFEKHLKSVKLPVEIDKVIKPADPLFAVARGCLLAAEASQ